MRENHRIAVAAGEVLWQQRVARIEHVTLEDITRTWVRPLERGVKYKFLPVPSTP